MTPSLGHNSNLCLRRNKTALLRGHLGFVMSKCLFFSMQVSKSKRVFHCRSTIIVMENSGFICVFLSLKALIYIYGLLVILHCCGEVLMCSSNSCAQLLHSNLYRAFYRALCTPGHLHGRFILHCMSLTSFGIYDRKEKQTYSQNFLPNTQQNLHSDVTASGNRVCRLAQKCKRHYAAWTLKALAFRQLHHYICSAEQSSSLWIFNCLETFLGPRGYFGPLFRNTQTLISHLHK